MRGRKNPAGDIVDQDSDKKSKDKDELSNIPEDLRKFFKTDNQSENRKEERNFVIME